MKIMIIGSMKFASEMVETRKKLNKLGHKALTPVGTKPHLLDKKFVDDLDRNLRYVLSQDIMRKNFKRVEECEAILVLNHKRNEIDGYIGISALMEMGLAHHLRKKIFLLYDTPHFNKVRWAHEVAIISPKILNGDLTKIK